MKFKQFFTLGLFLLLFFTFCPAAQAYLSRISADVWTTNYTDPQQQQLNVWIGITDTQNKNPPDIIASIEVTAPDGSILNLSPIENWLQYDRGYWAAFNAADFDGQQIPAGLYKVKVTPKNGFPIEQNDAIDATFLDPPVITFPTDGSTITTTPTIRWNPVPGATHYRILMWDDSWNEPVYWFWGNGYQKFFTDLPGAMIPLGKLKANHQYRLRIEARFGHQDLDKRSRSDWIYINTDAL